MQNKACIAELGAHYWFDIEGNVDNLYFLLNDYHVCFVTFITNDKFEQLRKPSGR